MLPQLFNYEGQEVRTVLQDGETWFVVSDACRILEISNPTDAVKRLDDDEITLVSIEGASNGLPVNAVNEPGLYSLILGSRKPEAKVFKRWITHEVIPAIRKTGSYSTQLTPTQALLKSVELLEKQEREFNQMKEAQTQLQTSITDHEFKLSEIDQKVTNEITLTTFDQSKLQGAVSSRVNKLAGKPYAGLYSALKRQFGVPSYRDIKKSDLSRAFEFIRCWSPAVGRWS